MRYAFGMPPALLCHAAANLRKRLLKPAVGLRMNQLKS